jgi:hypothetical protein
MEHTTDIWNLKVHPAADVFPMLSADELAELADDIKANGLVHPLVVKGDTLIDGRNRREACKIAGVVPTTVELNGADPVAYILSSNVNRRHMTKGQRAMAVAMIYPEPEKGGRGIKASVSEEFSGTRISMARTVLKYLPAMAQEVLRGKSLDEAYVAAKNEKTRSESFDERLAKIEAFSADLAARVRDETLSIEAAETEMRVRREAEAARIAGFTRALESLVTAFDTVLAERKDDTVGYLVAQAKADKGERTLPQADEVLRALRVKAKRFLDRTERR